MHTPGPWFTHGKLRRCILTTLDPRHSRQVAELSDLPSDEMTDSEIEANARLIAAAPELLDALQALVSVCENEGFPYLGNILPMARAAIDKATGE